MSVSSERNLRIQVFGQIQNDLEKNPPRSKIKSAQTAIDWIITYCNAGVKGDRGELPADLKVRRIFNTYMVPRVEVACQNLIERHNKLYKTLETSEEQVIVLLNEKILKPDLKTVKQELELLANWEKNPRLLLDSQR